jgi:hypothetical protein
MSVHLAEPNLFQGASSQVPLDTFENTLWALDVTLPARS